MLVGEVLLSAMPWPFEECRTKPRFPLARPVELQTSSGALHVETRDIGPGGAFVVSTTAVAVGSKVRMSYTVSGPDAFSQSFPFRYEGIVVRLARLAAGNFGLAIAWKTVEEGT